MKNVSRSTDSGGFYRNIQRFFTKDINWLKANLLLLDKAIIDQSDEQRYILGFDEVVEDKAGKQALGISWFYSSIASKAI